MQLYITLSKHEARIALGWYENHIKKYARKGGSHIIFPEEEIVLFKLKNIDEQTKFDLFDVEIIHGWMVKNLTPLPAKQTYYFDEEVSVVEKIEKFMQAPKS